MVPPVSSRPMRKAAAARALLPHQEVRLRVSEGSFNSLTPSVHENLSSHKTEATHQTAASLGVRISGRDDVLSAPVPR